jgi:hypothetical protein
MLRDSVPEQNCGAGEGEQCQGMPEPPGQAALDDVAHFGAARGDAGHRRDVVGLERVLHAEQKSQSQNSEHLSSARLTTLRPPEAASVIAIFGPEISRTGTSHRFAQHTRRIRNIASRFG